MVVRVGFDLRANQNARSQMRVGRPSGSMGEGWEASLLGHCYPGKQPGKSHSNHCRLPPPHQLVPAGPLAAAVTLGFT
jgi:hypothetical protein